MTATVSTSRSERDSIATATLKGSAALWFLVAVIGQWIFVYYIVAYFGPLIVQGGAAGLSTTYLPNGYIPGDTIGNLALIGHLFLAVIIIGGGPLQIMLGSLLAGRGPLRRMPNLMSRVRTVHHWNGRIYLPVVVITSIAGLYLTWTRPPLGDFSQQVGISGDAVLIIAFAAMTLRYAIARKIDMHRRWALRLFMVVSAVWFLRIGVMLWFVATGGAGINMETGTGPFLSFLSFADYLVPLFFLELYFRTQDRGGALAKFSMAILVLGLTLATAAGTFIATMGMWLPRL